MSSSQVANKIAARTQGADGMALYTHSPAEREEKLHEAQLGTNTSCIS